MNHFVGKNLPEEAIREAYASPKVERFSSHPQTIDIRKGGDQQTASKLEPRLYGPTQETIQPARVHKEKRKSSVFPLGISDTQVFLHNNFKS